MRDDLPILHCWACDGQGPFVGCMKCEGSGKVFWSNGYAFPYTPAGEKRALAMSSHHRQEDKS